MAEFNPIKALGEEISGILEVQKVVVAMEREAAADLGEAEARLNAARKITAWVNGELARKERALRKLTDESL